MKQRELKFRAWDKDNKQFIFSSWQFKITNDGVFWLDPTIADDRWKLLNPNGEIDRFEPAQQFTGLKDKGGKEIYEGDILEGDDGYYNFKIRYRVYWADGDFGWWVARYSIEGKELGTREQLYYVTTRRIVSVGDIFSTPELLRGH